MKKKSSKYLSLFLLAPSCMLVSMNKATNNLVSLQTTTQLKATPKGVTSIKNWAELYGVSPKSSKPTSKKSLAPSTMPSNKVQYQYVYLEEEGMYMATHRIK